MLDKLEQEEITFYDGTKLLSLLDINGEKPEIYGVSGNRASGKTTFFGRLLFSRSLKKNKKFMLIYRHTNELSDIADKFYKDIGPKFFPTWIMTDSVASKGAYINLYRREAYNKSAAPIHVGYAVSLAGADKIRKYSHLFSDVDSMLFDDFQTESSRYLPGEVNKLISIHTTVARGQGKMVRYVPLYMVSNYMSLINPYFTALGLSDKFTAETKYVRTVGCVWEASLNKDAQKAIQGSAFNRAFDGNTYVTMASQNVYLHDNITFIDTPKGKNKYVLTLKFEGREYAIRKFYETGYMYCSMNIDESFPIKIALTTDDHNINYLMLKSPGLHIDLFRYYYEAGLFRFQNLECKQCVLKFLSIY